MGRSTLRLVGWSSLTGIPVPFWPARPMVPTTWLSARLQACRTPQTPDLFLQLCAHVSSNLV